jgi:hypothetical protein
MNKETTPTIISIVATLAFMILAIDAVGYIMWAISGQIPHDTIYLGTLTAHTLDLIIN